MYKGDLVTLRGLEVTDLDELMKYWNREDVREFLFTIIPHSREEEEAWIRNTWRRRVEGKDYIFAITVNSEEYKYIGNVEISIENQINRRGLIGIAIFNPGYWGKGYGSDALKVILNFGFKSLNLHSIGLTVFENNLRARACYKKVGFQEMGRRRQAIFRNGQWIDELLLDILTAE
ncbi:MAG: N-acetyltransferase [Candidatus Heimdallarchaeota archaeon]|nr:N-acetyltransferase [Candidatus Heimdallarchaeota archaeon]